MDVILIIVVVVAVLVALGAMSRGKSRSAGSSRSRSSSPESSAKQCILDANLAWLSERWKMAETEQASGNLKHFPKWYFDEPTDRQAKRIADDGLSIKGKGTKGQYSDIIGLFVAPEDEELEKLKFFGVALKGPTLNQTRARHELAKIDSDPERQRAWLSRPASPLQKEFYRFIGEKAPPKLTHEQAEAKMQEAMEKLTEAQQDEWSTLENLVEEFEDREFRSDVAIRKPLPADIRAAIAALKAQGQEVDDPYDIAEKLLEIKSSLARGDAS